MPIHPPTSSPCAHPLSETVLQDLPQYRDSEPPSLAAGLDGPQVKQSRLSDNSRNERSTNHDNVRGLLDFSMTGTATNTNNTTILESGEGAAFELLQAYRARRRILQRAHLLTTEMDECVQEIVEETSLWHETAQNRATACQQRQLEATARHGQHEAARPVSEFSDGGTAKKDGRTAGGSIAVAATEGEAMAQKIAEKSGLLTRLRGIQRAIAEKENFCGQQRQRDRGMTDPQDGKAFNTPRVIPAEDLLETLRSYFVKQDEEELPPSPPSAFSSAALALTLELLGKSLAALVDTTDKIIVQATFRPRDEKTNLHKLLPALKMHVDHVVECHEVACRHLGHFESGETALLEGGFQEVKLLREQFLTYKEALTAQEQKEKSAKELHKSLHERYQKLTQRCDIWEEILLNIQKDPFESVLEFERDSSFSPFSRRLSIQRPSGELAGLGVSFDISRRNCPSTFLQQEHGHTVSALKVASSAQLQSHTASMTLERQVGAVWGNPYEVKMRLAAAAQSLSALTKPDDLGEATVTDGTHDPFSANHLPVPLNTAVSGGDPMGEVLDVGYTPESQHVAYGRALELLQRLLRTIPVHSDHTSSILTDEEPSKPASGGPLSLPPPPVPSTDTSEGQQDQRLLPPEATDDNPLLPQTPDEEPQRRLKTRTSIQNLIRYIVARSKPATADRVATR